MGIIAFIFVFYMPLYLTKKSVKPTKNIFDDFVDKDIGYPWSLDKDRKIAYKTTLLKRKNKVLEE